MTTAMFLVSFILLTSTRRRRRELARRELERIREGAQEPEDDVPLEEVINSIEWMLPNIAAVLRENLPRTP
jgi:hypothetical protein